MGRAEKSPSGGLRGFCAPKSFLPKYSCVTPALFLASKLPWKAWNMVELRRISVILLLYIYFRNPFIYLLSKEILAFLCLLKGILIYFPLAGTTWLSYYFILLRAGGFVLLHLILTALTQELSLRVLPPFTNSQNDISALSVASLIQPLRHSKICSYCKTR